MGRLPSWGPAVPPSASVSPEGPDRGQDLEGPPTVHETAPSPPCGWGPGPGARSLPTGPLSPSPGCMVRQAANLALGALVAWLSIPVVLNLLSPKQVMNSSFNPLRIVNTYGAFGRYCACLGVPSRLPLWPRCGLSSLSTTWETPGQRGPALISQVGTLGRVGLRGLLSLPQGQLPPALAPSTASAPAPPGVLWVERQPPPAITQSPACPDLVSLTASPGSEQKSSCRARPAPTPALRTLCGRTTSSSASRVT